LFSDLLEDLYESPHTSDPVTVAVVYFSTRIQMELQIDSDLVSIRSKVRRLRAALVSRCIQRNQHSSGRPGLPILPEQRLVRLPAIWWC